MHASTSKPACMMEVKGHTRCPRAFGTKLSNNQKLWRVSTNTRNNNPHNQLLVKARSTVEGNEQAGAKSWSIPTLGSAALTAAAFIAVSPAGAQVMDASTAHLLSDILRPTFALFTCLYIVRIPLTWYPSIDTKAFPWNLAVAPTEPVLSVTRKVIPLVGGVDVTPIVWVALISFFNEVLLGPQGLLVLIERQGGL